MEGRVIRHTPGHVLFFHIGIFFVNSEAGADFVLQAQFLFGGFSGVVLPKAAVGDGEEGGLLFAAFGGGEFVPTGWRIPI